MFSSTKKMMMRNEKYSTGPRYRLFFGISDIPSMSPVSALNKWKHVLYLCTHQINTDERLQINTDERLQINTDERLQINTD
jgi:hypothetical protein